MEQKTQADVMLAYRAWIEAKRVYYENPSPQAAERVEQAQENYFRVKEEATYGQTR